MSETKPLNLTVDERDKLAMWLDQIIVTEADGPADLGGIRRKLNALDGLDENGRPKSIATPEGAQGDE